MFMYSLQLKLVTIVILLCFHFLLCCLTSDVSMPLQHTAGMDLGTRVGYGMIMSTAVGCRIDTTRTSYLQAIPVLHLIGPNDSSKSYYIMKARTNNLLTLLYRIYLNSTVVNIQPTLPCTIEA